jgi:hypothetical protein
MESLVSLLELVGRQRVAHHCLLVSFPPARGFERSAQPPFFQGPWTAHDLSARLPVISFYLLAASRRPSSPASSFNSLKVVLISFFSYA